MTAVLRLKPDDHVASTLEEARKGARISLSGYDPDIDLVANEDIRRYHKIALADIAAGDDVVRDGYIIGRAKMDIKRGDWVHVHNLKSKRGLR